jgi:hypothetical protein
VSLEQFATERRCRPGSLLYLRSKPGFPKPVLRHGRDVFYEREDIKRFLKETVPHYWISKC